MLAPNYEKEILKFWEKNKIFKKLKKKNQGRKHWSFLDGPITANNPMGVHHGWGRTYKDLFQRYKAMQGFDQRFQNGFDCQGLWVEVEVEKELGLKTKKEIENLIPGDKKASIAKFVELCKDRVKKFSKIQTGQSIRLGQWMDWENSYYTMSDENNYAIWHFLKKCKERGLIYKGHDTVAWCPRCETAISQHEILTEDYKEITHDSVIFKLPIINKGWEDTYLLVWTTTPWTILANVAVGINSKYTYGIWRNKKSGAKDRYIFLYTGEEGKPPSRDGLSLEAWVMDGSGKTIEMIGTISTTELLNLKYKGAFDDLDIVKSARKENPETFHSIVDVGDFVNDEEGTGLLHIAPGAGQEDFKIAKKEKLSVISPIGDNADYLGGMGKFTAKNAKKEPQIIINFLKESGYLFNKKLYLHRYPVCWRCKEELVWKVADEWYISMDNLRNNLIDSAKKIKWIPYFGLEREIDWLKNMDDWLISKKNRYWGLALPIYECQKCGNFEVIGSKKELKERAVEGWQNFEGLAPHRPFIDEVKIKCLKCSSVVPRIADVGNPWLDAGIVPFSTLNYFSNKKYWQKWFPPDFICESFPGQFKNWFYSLIVMSQVLEETAPVKTIFGYATVVDEKGEEMHKSKGNAIWFDEAVEKIGADVMRWMYTKSNPVYNLRFGYNIAEETKRKLLFLWNSYVFFTTYVSKENIAKLKSRVATQSIKSKCLLDQWIISRLENLIKKTTQYLDKYEAAGASKAIEKFFIEDLSLWYIRRSRRKFQKPSNKKELIESSQILYFVLITLVKLMASFCPFFSEYIYQSLKKQGDPKSVHLCRWPSFNNKLINLKLEKKMEAVRDIVSLSLAKRAKFHIKVRQPLNKLSIKNLQWKLEKEFINVIKEEVNVKNADFSLGKNELKIELDTRVTTQLKKEGILRDIVRQVMNIRKKLGLSKEDRINVYFDFPKSFNWILEGFDSFIKKEIYAQNLMTGKEECDFEKVVKLDQKYIWIGVKKI